jgi:hypothetical protein
MDARGSFESTLGAHEGSTDRRACASSLGARDDHDGIEARSKSLMKPFGLISRVLLNDFTGGRPIPQSLDESPLGHRQQGAEDRGRSEDSFVGREFTDCVDSLNEHAAAKSCRVEQRDLSRHDVPWVERIGVEGGMPGDDVMGSPE